MISSSSGKRPSSCLEKTIVPSATTSKMPFAPSMSSGVLSSASAILAARLEALGRYFHRPQYVMETRITAFILPYNHPVARW
jgi:hypothetical protein